jgi:hypothetical protein
MAVELAKLRRFTGWIKLRECVLRRARTQANSPCGVLRRRRLAGRRLNTRLSRLRLKRPAEPANRRLTD